MRMLAVLDDERVAREELRQVADEQAALRRVATLVAHGGRPTAVFAAVAEEAGRLLPADVTMVGRYEPDGEVTNAGVWSRTGDALPTGTRARLGGRNVSTLVFQTGRAVRLDSYGADSGLNAWMPAPGLRSSVGAPISVGGRLWGVIIAASRHEQALPTGAETRLAGFTELVAAAIANADAHAELTASRARIVAIADETRRRIERDLHDGAQQRLVSLALQLRAVQAAMPAGMEELKAELGGVAAGLTSTLDDLREYARGIHPAILANGGLAPALRTLARRSPVVVELDVQTTARLPDRVEVAAYYVVSEALTNAAKHAHASAVHVAVDLVGEVVRLSVRDDGIGGADQARGSGLSGLKDRVAAAGGTLTVHSRPGRGTHLIAELPAGFRPAASGQAADPSLMSHLAH
jgi:signal transduction histidine kinase